MSTRRFVAAFSFLWVMTLPVAAMAQAPATLIAPGDATLSHIDLNVPDVTAAKAFWALLGGTPATWGKGKDMLEGVTYGKVGIVLHKADNVGPAIGAGINHIGLHVPDVQKDIAIWKAAGLKTEPGKDAQQSFVWSPGDLIRVEILEVPGQVLPEIFHHVHFFVYPNEAGGIPEMQAWYQKMFGTIPGERAGFKTDNLPGGELAFAPSATPTAPSAGRAIDHIAFAIKDLAGYCKSLKAQKVKLDTSCKKGTAFLTDPWGDRLELNQAKP